MIFAFFFSKIFWLLGEEEHPRPRLFRPKDWAEGPKCFLAKENWLWAMLAWPPWGHWQIFLT